MPISSNALLDLNKIYFYLGDKAPLFSVFLLAECTSTNSILMEQKIALVPNKLNVLCTEKQTAGRGRRGHLWQSWLGRSLTFSLHYPLLKKAKTSMSCLPLVVGLAISQVLEDIQIPNIQLKWPNDVLIQGAKVSGILCEILNLKTHNHAAIIGIGLNMSLPDEQQTLLFPATAIDQHLSSPVDRNYVLARLLIRLNDILQIYQQEGFSDLRGDWLKKHAFQNQEIQIIGEHETIKGLCIGVDHSGALIVETSQGIQHFYSGNISLRRS